jgi:hypothetical protein
VATNVLELRLGREPFVPGAPNVDDDLHVWSIEEIVSLAV